MCGIYGLWSSEHVFPDDGISWQKGGLQGTVLAAVTARGFVRA